MPKVEGVCKGYFERYYYNKESNACEAFVYGGCQGKCVESCKWILLIN